MSDLQRAWMPPNIEMPMRRALTMGLTAEPKADLYLKQILMVDKLTRLVQEMMDEGGHPEDLIESILPDVAVGIRMEAAKTAKEIAKAMVYRSDRITSLLSEANSNKSNVPNLRAATYLRDQTLSTFLEDLSASDR